QPPASDPTSSNKTKHKPFILIFLSSADPVTGELWCPDVRAAMPVLGRVFGGPGAGRGGDEGDVVDVDGGWVWVGGREEYKSPTNTHRTAWQINAIPCVVRYERVDGVVREVGRLVEGEVLEEEALRALVAR
ncbi:hypothetical protein J1614_009922, partial [Plenodomus biglobosus]